MGFNSGFKGLNGMWFIYTGGHDHGKREGHMFSRANATFLLEPHNHDHNEWQHSERTAKMSSRKKVGVACTLNLNCCKQTEVLKRRSIKRCLSMWWKISNKTQGFHRSLHVLCQRTQHIWKCHYIHFKHLPHTIRKYKISKFYLDV